MAGLGATLKEIETTIQRSQGVFIDFLQERTVFHE